MHSLTHTITRDDEDLDIEIEFEVAPRVRGCFYGPPEHCEPDSGGEIEELTVTYDGQPFTLTDAERDRIEQRIYETREY